MSVATPTVDVAAARARIAVDASNVAPTAGLACGFGGFDTGGVGAALTAATFVSAGRVLCAPPARWWRVAHVHITTDLGGHWSAPGPAISLYNSSQPAVVTSLSPACLLYTSPSPRDS